jgi:hypothetical protein
MVDQLNAYLAARQLNWEELDIYLKLRLELFELDTRFGMLGDGGIFNLLDRAGALHHRIDGVENIEQAMTDPPAVGRAKFRSAAIRQCAPRRSEFGCDWDCIHHFDTDRFLDLSDPWTEHADWSEEPRPAPERSPGLHRLLTLRQARQRLQAAARATPDAAEAPDALPVRAEDIQF